MAFVYMVRCKDGSLYTGYALDIGQRLRSHYERDARCAKYTRSHPVTALACLWQTESPTAARKLEYRIKSLSAAEKRALLTAPAKVKDLFPELGEYNFVWLKEARLEDYLTQDPASVCLDQDL